MTAATPLCLHMPFLFVPSRYTHVIHLMGNTKQKDNRQRPLLFPKSSIFYRISWKPYTCMTKAFIYIKYRSHRSHRSKAIFTPSLFLHPLRLFLTMCIQWCCKNCLDKLTILTHYWARERCNDYYIARSQDRTTTDCPRGPWVLQRAYHRNPYKGAQRCDECIKAGRKDSKRMQMARQKNNVALGERREYSGALNVGELVIPEGFQHTPQPLARGQLDVEKSGWENFAANASTVTQQINGEDSDPRMALAETNYRSPYQPVQHPPMHNIYKGRSTIGENISRDMDPKLSLTKPNYSTPAAGTPQGLLQDISNSNHFTPNLKTGTIVQGQASDEMHRGPRHQIHLPLRASSSQSTRLRPWLL